MSDIVPTYFNFAYDTIERWAAERPENLALWWVDEALENQRKITFGEMACLLRQASNFFESLGIRRGDHVLIILQRVPQWWIAMLGLVRLGAVPIPGTPFLTSKDIKYRVDAAQVRAVITDDAGAQKINGFAGQKVIVGQDRHGWVNFDAGMAKFPTERAYEPIRSTEPGIIYFTSGTAGEAKMVLHTQASVGMGHAATGKYWLDLRPGDVIWTLADTGWAKTAWSSFYGPWSQGATVFTMDMRNKFDPNLVLRTLEKCPITVFCSPATALRLIIRKDLSVHRFPRLRHCVSAGEALNAPIVKIWKDATGLTIHEGYGQTETVCLIGNFPSLGHEVRPGVMGRAMPGYTIGIVDEDGREVPTGVPGQIAVRVSPERPIGILKEYLNNPEETAAKFVGDWYLTGDTGWRDAEGYYHFVGRADDVINSSSYRIGPSEVESALLEHPAVLEAGVIGVPEEMRGEIVKAYVVLRPGFEPGDHLKHELQQHCKRVTAPYKYPRQIEFVEELPKTISGKIRRVELRARSAKEGHPHKHGAAGKGT